MSRLIDAEQMEQHIMESKVFTQYFKELVRALIWAEDAIDAVQVVRCRECKYRKLAKVNYKGYTICPESGMEITDDAYCAYGVKKEGENE